MIGVIHKVLFDLLHQQGGPDLVARVAGSVDLDPETIRISESYPDEQFATLLQSAITETGLPRYVVIDAYADAFLAYARNLFPAFFSMSSNSFEFLKRQPKIHTSISASLLEESERDRVENKFSLIEEDDGSLSVSYRSRVGLCDLYHALAHKIAAHYGDSLVISAETCGSGRACALRLFFNQSPDAALLSKCLEGHG